MEHGLIDFKRQISKEKLDPNQYTVSLLKEGVRLGVLDKQDMYGIQGQVMQLLRDLIMRYTKGESSSVKVETAEKLMNSLYYSIDAYLYGFDEPGEALKELKTGSIKEMYEKGIVLVKECVAEARNLYKKAAGMKLDVQLIAYNTTVSDAIPKFFREYSVVFEAHETMADIDYPLAVDTITTRGIYYMKQYLEILEMETRFCNCFDGVDIRKLLQCYGRLSGIDHREPLVNIFELVVNNSIFSVLSGGDACKPIITGLQYRLLRERILCLSPNEIIAAVDAAIERMISDLCIEDSTLISYIGRYRDLFLQRLVNAASNDSLANMVLIEPERKSGTESSSLEQGSKMSDEGFRVLVRKIAGCGSIAEKTEIIKSGIRSLQDFIDILHADCLFGDEYAAFFATLSDMELAVLGKAAAEEDRLGEEWQEEYTRFLNGLEKDRKQVIEERMNSIGVL